MRTYILAGLLAALPLAAEAQNTNCQMVMNVWQCRQQPEVQWGNLQTPNFGASFAAGVAQRQAMMARQQQMQAYQAQMAATQADQEIRARVGGLIAQGRCQDASAAALGAGRFDLAAQVPQLCHAGPAAPAEPPPEFGWAQ